MRRFSDYFGIVRAEWLVFTILPLVGVMGALTVSVVQRPLYESTSQAFVSVRGSQGSVLDLSQGNAFAQQIISSYAEVATSPTVLDPVISRLHLAVAAQDLARSVSVATSTSTVVMSITVTDSSSTRAASIANAITSQLSYQVAALSRSSSGESTVTLTQIEPAQPSLAPASPNAPVNVILGLILGLFVASLLAAARRALKTTLTSPEDMETSTGLPVLGVIPRDDKFSDGSLLYAAHAASATAEAVRSLRTRVRFTGVGRSSISVLITSAGPTEGKTAIASNLAASMAGVMSVVLVDADLRRPRVASALGIDGSVGLTDVLVGATSLDEALQAWGDTGLCVLASGLVPPNPNELLQSLQMQSLLGELCKRFDAVIVDTPPCLLVSDALTLARQGLDVVLVGAIGRTRRQDIQAVARSLSAASANVVGTIATFVKMSSRRYRYLYGEEV